MKKPIIAVTVLINLLLCIYICNNQGLFLQKGPDEIIAQQTIPTEEKDINDSLKENEIQASLPQQQEKNIINETSKPKQKTYIPEQETDTAEQETDVLEQDVIQNETNQELKKQEIVYFKITGVDEIILDTTAEYEKGDTV